MATPIFSILRALAPLIADAGRVAVGMRTNGAARTEERVAQLERETMRTGEILKGLAEQLQVVAEQLRVEADVAEQLRQKAKTMLILSASALAIGVASLIVAIFR